MKRAFFLVLLFCFLFFCDDLFAQGCSQCKLTAEQASDVDQGSFGNNINSGILYLMLIPYLILAFLFRTYIVSFFKKLTKRA